MPLTLIAPPGLSDLPDSALNAEEIAQGQHAVKILENTKFGVVRPEFFYMGRFSDGQTVARPTSAVDNLPYLASEVIYLWEIVLTADARDGITSGAGTILYFDYRVEQKADGSPGLVHCKTVYHAQGGGTTETRDGELSVWAIGVRGLDQLDLAAIPAWANVPDADLDLDSAWREDRLKSLNAAAKRSVVQAEFFDLGEFGNGQTVPRPTSDVDGFLYPYADLVFLTSWRWTPAFATGLSSGPSGHTVARLEKNVNGATGLVDTTVTYRWGASSDTVTQDGRVRVFAFGFRAGITATGTVSFTDLSASVFLPGKPPLDDDTLVMVRNSKFAALRPEFFVTTQAHGSTVPLPTSPIDGYAYARAELIYLYARSDTAAPGAIGSVLTLLGFIRQDTGAVTLKTLYYRQGGSTTTTSNGTFRVVTVALRSKIVEVDSDPNDAGGGEPGFEGALISPGGVLLMLNPNLEGGDRDWTKGTGFTIEEDAGNAYDGDWVARHTGVTNSTLDNDVFIPVAEGDRIFAAVMVKKPTGSAGGGKLRISWRNLAKAEIGSASGAVISSTAYSQSRRSARAPALAAFAVIQGAADLAPDGDVFFDAFRAAFFPLDLDEVDDSPTRLAPDPVYFDSARRPNRLRRTADDLEAGDIFRYQGAGAQDADDVPVSAARTFISPSYVDGSLRPDRLRRAAADLLAADIIKVLEESRLDALNLTNAPAEAGAEVTTGKSLTLLINRTLANIADTASRFAAVEAGANKTETRTAADTALVSGKTASSVKDETNDWLSTRVFSAQLTILDTDDNIWVRVAAVVGANGRKGFTCRLALTGGGGVPGVMTLECSFDWGTQADVVITNASTMTQVTDVRVVRDTTTGDKWLDIKVGSFGSSAVLQCSLVPYNNFGAALTAPMTKNPVIGGGEAAIFNETISGAALLSMGATGAARIRKAGGYQTGANIVLTDAGHLEAGRRVGGDAGPVGDNVFDKTADDADNVPESTTKKWAGETGATVGADWPTDVSGRPAELTDGRVANALTPTTGVILTDKVVEASVLAGALALAKMKADSLARMFTADAKRTNVEGLESGAKVATDKVIEASLTVGIVAVAKLKTETVNRIWATQAQKDAAVDVDGNLLLKNVDKGSATTSSPTTSSATFADLPEMTITVTTKGNTVLLLFAGQFDNLGGGDKQVELRLLRDVTEVGIRVGHRWGTDVAVRPTTISLSHLDEGASAASHTWKIQWRIIGIGTVRALLTNREMQLTELG